jgi:outer membrane immunogenic protein
MKRLLLAIGLLTAGYPAFAGDLGDRWSGFHVGINLGGGHASNTTGVESTLRGGPVTINDPLPATLKPSGSGYFGGGQIGYDYRIDRMVLGVETDLQGGQLNFSAQQLAPPTGAGAGLPNSFISTSDKMDWFGTLRGRVGAVITPNLLTYVTAGAALGHLTLSADAGAFGIINYPASISSVKLGWTAGAGEEFALGDRWTARFEYLYVKFSGDDATASSTAGFNGGYQEVYHWSDVHEHLLRASLNYKFGALQLN